MFGVSSNQHIYICVYIYIYICIYIFIYIYIYIYIYIHTYIICTCGVCVCIQVCVYIQDFIKGSGVQVTTVQYQNGAYSRTHNVFPPLREVWGSHKRVGGGGRVLTPKNPPPHPWIRPCVYSFNSLHIFATICIALNREQRDSCLDQLIKAYHLHVVIFVVITINGHVLGWYNRRLVSFDSSTCDTKQRQQLIKDR